MNTWGVLLKNSFFFRVQEWQLRVWKEKEKLRKFINLTLIYKILNKDNGSSMTMCIIIILGKENQSWLCAIGREKHEVPWQVCLSSTAAVLFCTLSCIPCHSSPCSFNMMDLFSKSFRWWEDRKRRKLTLDHKTKILASLIHPNSPFSSSSLIIIIICRKENKWLSDMILWVCWLLAQSTMEREFWYSLLVWLEFLMREKKMFVKFFN